MHITTIQSLHPIESPSKSSLFKVQKMASSFQCLSTGFLSLSLFFFVLHFCTVLSVEFEVGGDKGWVIPPSKDTDFFNEWASKNRFKMNDTLRFTYKKDSVMVVTQAEYEKCRSSHPIYFSNNGDTIFTLDRAGLFYFISGVSGHCERGVKMIIKVLEPESPPQATNHTTEKSGAVELASAASSATTIMFILSLFGAIFM